MRYYFFKSLHEIADYLKAHRRTSILLIMAGISVSVVFLPYLLGVISNMIFFKGIITNSAKLWCVGVLTVGGISAVCGVLYGFYDAISESIKERNQ